MFLNFCCCALGMILGLISGSFLADFGIENRWKSFEKSIKKQMKNRIRFGIDFWPNSGRLGYDFWSISGRFGVDSGLIWPKMRPKLEGPCGPCRRQLDPPKSTKYRSKNAIHFRCHFLIDFLSILGPNFDPWKPKNHWCLVVFQYFFENPLFEVGIDIQSDFNAN